MSGDRELLAAAAGRRELRYGARAPSPELAERMLEVSTRFVLGARERNPALAALDLEGELERLEHEWVDHRGGAIHVEHHRDDPAAPTFVVVHGLGDHARRHLGLAAALAERGLNSLLVDRHGHGLSEGRRGDATLEADLEATELALALARSRGTGPVVLLGDSLGGILSWYLLTRGPDIDAAVCHCIGHPDVDPDPSSRFKRPLIRALARVLPRAPVAVGQLADYGQVALDPQTKRYFDERLDPLFNFSVSLRAVASYLEFAPGIAWERVSTPTLVLIGALDGMVTPQFTRRSLERARPPRAEYLEIAGAGHQLFLDHLGSAIGPLADWVEAALGSVAAPAGGA